ncbi:chaperonin [Carex littledalei]|uniref:Chaperonin n=1 Tax=Carex littledalei TaxID=544730 RepID=A0A833VTH9_9POAL|nr:chaperonin [Carex littledalei]
MMMKRMKDDVAENDEIEGVDKVAYAYENEEFFGPGALDENGNIPPLNITPGSTVIYSKYANKEFKSDDSDDYIVLS